MTTERTHDDVEVVPLPGQENDAERRRVRQSNDRDQRAEREGERAPHNAGYDEVADGAAPKPDDPMSDD